MKENNLRVIESEFQGGEKIIAIDTALGSSVAVFDGKKIFEARSADTMGHAEAIGTLLELALDSAGLKPQEVDVVVAGMGPGPFTGLRVGIAAANAFALGVKAKRVGVVSHDAAALEHYENSAAKRFRVIQDAKRRELFVSEYEGLNEDLVPVRVSGPAIALAADFANLEADLKPTEISAAYMVLLAQRLLAAGLSFYEGQALYLRDPDVKVSKPSGS